MLNSIWETSNVLDGVKGPNQQDPENQIEVQSLLLLSSQEHQKNRRAILEMVYQTFDN